MLVMISLGRLPDARAVACRACAVRIASRTTREIGIPTCRSRAAMRASSGARRTFRSFTSVIVKTPCLYVKHRAPTAAFAGAPRWCACRYPSASAHGQEADKLVGPRSSAAGRPLQSSARYCISVEMAGSTGFEPATSGLTVQCANQAAPRARESRRYHAVSARSNLAQRDEVSTEDQPPLLWPLSLLRGVHLTSAGSAATTLEEPNAADSRRTLNATLLKARTSPLHRRQPRHLRRRRTHRPTRSHSRPARSRPCGSS